ncbi:hypothetical protein Taro_003407 [Colocasia esculenta]|uniref:Uncharacterized protein n=1 Tax=Colocasia esculenta TaxID=4460 RepID=A0A843TM21_COLES|nr:hypothetical protein [Colocasia esculenta]
MENTTDMRMGTSKHKIHADNETSHYEGEGSYSETMQAVWINEGYDLLYDMFMRNHRFTKRESYSRGMEERYRDDSQCLELDLDI